MGRTILLFTIKVIDPRNAPTVSMSTEASGGISMERQRRLAEDVNAAANANPAVKNGEEVSYCHQCGAVFNRMSANFCSQCGCKRSYFLKAVFFSYGTWYYVCMFIYRTVGVVVLPRASSSFYLPHRLLLKFCALCDSSRVTLLYSINT